MKYSVVETRVYRKSLRRCIRSGNFRRDELDSVIDVLADGKKLPKKYRDHNLTGSMKGFRECHISPDMLLIYQIRKDVLVLVLVNLGSHSELFG